MPALENLMLSVAGIIVASVVLAILIRRTTRPSLPLPPGPKPLPIIGNLLDIPVEKEWLTYHSWSQKYGDVVYAEALGQKILVLSSMEAVSDLLERRSALYSDRPSSCMLIDL